MRLSNDLIDAYNRDGYLRYGDMIGPEEVETLREAYMSTLAVMREENRLHSARRGLTMDGKQTEVYQIRSPHLRHPAFERLMRHPRLLDAVESLIGPNIRVVLYQGLYKPPHTGGIISWHQDDFYFQVDKEDAVVSCWLALDDATVDNGCMWVVPGMHRSMLEHEDDREAGGKKIVALDDSAAVPVELKAGQCMFHHGLAPHRTLPNTSDRHRRALAIHYMDGLAKPLDSDRKFDPDTMPVVRGLGIDW